MNHYDDERDDFLDELTTMLEDARKPDARVNVAELRSRGVPANTARMIARESANVRTRGEARALAARATAEIFNRLESVADLSTSDLADHVIPRG